jgi:hypothetical protein
VLGAGVDARTQAAIAAKLAEGSVATSIFPAAFLAGAIHGAALSIAETISAIFHLPEILAKVDEMIRLLLSSQGTEVAEALGFAVGQRWAGEVAALLEMNPVQTSYWMGKKAGPVLAAILIALVTGGIIAMASRSWAMLREGFGAMVDLSRLRMAQAASGVRVLQKPPTGGMVRTHTDGTVEWWVPAESLGQMTRAAGAAAGGAAPAAPFAPRLPGAVQPVLAGPQLPATAADSAVALSAQTAVAGAQLLTTRAHAVLSQIAPLPPAEVEGLLKAWLDRLVAAYPNNPDVQRVDELARIVWIALRDPEAYAHALGELEVTRRMLVDSPVADAAAYLEAARLLAASRGVEVMELRLYRPDATTVVLTSGNQLIDVLPANAGLVPGVVFLQEIVASERWFIDLAALNLTEGGTHGALTHLLQDLVADRALRTHDGTTAIEFRQLLGRLQRLQYPGDDPTQAGLDVWQSTYDSLDRSLAVPDVVWPPLRDLLNIEPGEL